MAAINPQSLRHHPLPQRLDADPQTVTGNQFTLRATWRGLETWNGRDTSADRRASPRPYLREAGGEIPLAYSPVYPDGEGICLPGGGDGLVQPAGFVVASVDHHGGRFLRLGGNTRTQDPIYALQSHAIYNFGSGIWVSADATYFAGGQTTINGRMDNDLQQNWRFGTTASFPLDRLHSIRLTPVTARMRVRKQL